MKDYILTNEGFVKSNWIDINGHLNIRWYTKIFDDANFSLLEKIGIDKKTIKKDLLTVVAGRIFMSYRQELIKGDFWQVKSGLTYINSKHLVLSHRLISNDIIKSTCEISGTPISLKNRSVTNLNKKIINKAKKYFIEGSLNFYSKIL